LALTGAAAGLALWAVDAAALRGGWPERADFAASVFAFTFFASVLAMTGPLALRRAVLSALPVAVAVAGFLSMAALRFGTVAEFQMSGLPFLAAFVLGFVPLPFLVVAAGQGWTNYPALFAEGWRMVVRAVAAWVFAGLVWGVIWLSDALLGLVALGFMEALTTAGPLPGMLTGAALGLGVAAAAEGAGDVAPDLVLRLIRMLAPPVLAVAALFMVALPLRGMEPLPGGISAAGVLLAVAAVIVVLVSVLAGPDDEAAAQGRVQGPVGMALAGLLVVPVVLAVWALAVRVGQHGWTPGRLFAALMAVVMAGYALAYLAALARGGRWRVGVRLGNLAMAPVLALAAALWLSPLLNAEAISSRGLVERYEAGQVAAGDLDVAALAAWGKPGAAALARLEALAAEPGHEALAVKLAAKDAAEPVVMPEEAAVLLAELRSVMPVQPAGAVATRDMLLAAIPAVEVQTWIEACRTPLPGTERPGCVFVVADLWTAEPGEEGLVLLREPAGYVRYEGLGLGPQGVARRSVAAMSGALPDRAEGERLIAALQDAPPAVQVAPMNMLAVEGGLILLP
jgi:hypothetical protein